MDNRLMAYGDVPNTLAQVSGAADVMAAAVRGLQFDAPAARATLDRSFAFGSDLAELVMREGGVDYRTAHALVGAVARDVKRDARAAGAHAPFLPTLEALDAAGRSMLGRPLGLAPERLAAALDPFAALERRRGAGGAATPVVTAMIAGVRERLGEAAGWQTRTAERVAGAEQRLLALARRMAAAA
jgi:argininosuccinate lyase